ncbi:Putative Family 41 glycosyltransferase (Fragment) [Rhizopus microsporus]
MAGYLGQNQAMFTNSIPNIYDDSAAFAYFQQMSPTFQQALLTNQQSLSANLHEQVILEQQQQQQLEYTPPIMAPPQSPTLSSYYFESGWVNHYYDPKRRQYLSSRVDHDYQQKHRHSQLLQQQYILNQQHPMNHDHHRIIRQHSFNNIIPQPFPTTLGSTTTTLPPVSNPYLNAAAAAAAAASATVSSTQGTVYPEISAHILHSTSSDELRESLLQFAHNLYSTAPQNPYLLPLLHSLHDAFPNHLPTILLLACVYYSYQDYASSLRFNQLILKHDANYVEAMSNIGTTLRTMGKAAEAERWWYQAVKLRPGYWDAVENLVGVLCAKVDDRAEGDNPRYKEALTVCEFVEKYFYSTSPTEPLKMPKQLPPHQLPRLQNLFYAKGNLKYALGDIQGAQREYEKGLELAFNGVGYSSLCKLIAFTCSGGMLPASSTANAVPLVLLQPDQAARILHMIFPTYNGMLPSLTSINYSANSKPGAGSLPGTDITSAIQQTNQTTATILLTLAKLFQDMMNPTTPALIAAAAAPSPGCTAPTLPTLIPLYYLSLALNPSPSTANNLGIILSNIPGAIAASAIKPAASSTTPLTGTMLAMQYYMYGLQLDPRHPHLYTNLGSLLKDMGHLNEAVAMYEKAVEYNPRFDVALANLGNAIKDMGRVQDSVQWYRRAVEVNPNFVDAICGLANSLNAVCDWRGRGTSGEEPGVDQVGHYFIPSGSNARSGWIGRVVDIVEKQLDEGAIWGAGILKLTVEADTKKSLGEHLVELLLIATEKHLLDASKLEQITNLWRSRLLYYADQNSTGKRDEGGWLIRLVERILRRLQRNWYIETYGHTVKRTSAVLEPDRISVTPELAQKYARPMLPSSLPPPPVPTVLPFHTFTYPLNARQIRLISHRNALRVSHIALTSSWVPTHVYPPPPPPSPRLKLGYVSSDFNNHPLSHLMQSVFGFHDRNKYQVFCYATTPSDNSPYRQKIERESESFLDVSTWTNEQVIQKIIADGIHVLINLNGYTKGARNEIFAARPCPVQCSFMGFAGTLGGGWCDWIIADPVVCPPEMVSGEVWRRRKKHEASETTPNGDFEGDVDPEEDTNDFVYTEKFIYMPHSYFVNDHKQGFRDDQHQEAEIYKDKESLWAAEEDKRWKMRHEVFPNLPDDVVIFANFNQLYKLEPSTFRLWLRILERVPNSILWLLRFPPAGEHHLRNWAVEWGGPQVAQRVIFTDVAPKHIHIHRGRVADIFLDTPECNAHTTAADILWSGTPIVTYPKYPHKMCSRVGASIAMATGYGEEMIVTDEQQYEAKAVELASSLTYTYTPAPDSNIIQRRGHGKLMNLRKRLFLTREHSRLFDTLRWTQNLEKGYDEAWRRWVTAEEFEDISEKTSSSGCIWITDPDDSNGTHA